MLGAMAHAAGARFGKHAAESLPCVVSLAAAAREEGSEALRETCLRTLERFAEECPRAVAPSLKEVVLESLKLVAHDPLYGDDDGAEDGADDMDADGDDDDDGSEYGSEYDASEYSDDGDDDASWKIRRGATRVLRAVSSKAPFVMEAKTTDGFDGATPLRLRRPETRRSRVARTGRVLPPGGVRRARSRAARGVAVARRLFVARRRRRGGGAGRRHRRLAVVLRTRRRRRTRRAA
jgi:hypothetical protein